MALTLHKQRFLCVFVVLGIIVSHNILETLGKRKTAAEWNKMMDEKKIEEIEEMHKKGDDEEELKTEDMYEYERMEARRNVPAEPPANFDETAAEDWFKHAKAQSGPTMVFAKLNHTLPDGKTKLTKELCEETGAKWREQLFLGGVEVTPYAIEFDTLLMTVQRGWNGAQLKEFLLSREEVVEVEWDQIKYKPERLKTKEEKRQRRRKKKKKRKKKSKSKTKGKKNVKKKKTKKMNKKTKGKTKNEL